MKQIIKYITIVLIFTGLFSCEILDPIDENLLTRDYIQTDPASAEGLLMQGYTKLLDQYQFNEAATDDAVSNQLDNGYNRMATGELSAKYNPANRWEQYERVFYINQFIDVVDKGTVAWSLDEFKNNLFAERLKGEALALRALFHFYVLQAHAGVGESGELKGIPYFKEFIEPSGEFDFQRPSFAETVSTIMQDLDAALDLLPTDYSDSESDVDPKYEAMEGYEFGAYKRVNGAQYMQRVSGRIVKAIKARVALFAASPAFLNGSGGYYQTAANVSADLLADIGGVDGLSSDGLDFYLDINSSELLWHGALQGANANQEENHFPPSRNGEGQMNPSHNLVSAFPMANGYPATVENGYDPQDPYSGRDSRLKKYIVTNGSSIGGGTINIGVGGGVDRVDSLAERSTTTGYYMRKLLNPDVRINDDGTTSDKQHFDVFYRYTELFLIFAEAANEIGGPMHMIDGISAYDVMSAIRERAGIAQPDEYLATMTTKEQMRELIRNERRLELCFEGHRFWDVRRWNLPLNETITGYFFDGVEYVELPAVKTRNYPSYATYLPIDYREVLKFGIEQNQGW